MRSSESRSKGSLMTEAAPECLDDIGEKTCFGPVEFRFPMSGTGASFPRCHTHFEIAFDRYEETNRRYPKHAPNDFDPSYAGERWDDDY